MAIHLPGDVLNEVDVLGKIYLNGAWGNWQTMGPCTDLTVQAGADVKDNMDYRIGKSGQITGSATVAKPAEMKAVFTQISKLAAEMLTFGTSEEINDTSSTATATAGAMYAGDIIPFDYMGVSGVSMTGGGGALTVDEDYTVNLVAGYASLLTDQTAGVTAEFTYPTATGFKVTAYQNTLFKMSFDIRGVSLTNGRKMRMLIHEVNCVPTSPFAIMGTDFIKAELSGKLITPAGKSAAYWIKYYD